MTATLGAMNLRESKQWRADGSVVTYLQLAENVWDAAKGRSQASIVHNCERADDPEVVERLRRLAKSILRRCSPEGIVGSGGDWPLICAWTHGGLYVLEAIWKQLGIDAIVRRLGTSLQATKSRARHVRGDGSSRSCALIIEFGQEAQQLCKITDLTVFLV